ncbi:hypothetical protein AQUSIP_12480 [Aquicella siphonis]|uniref:Outer membrane protein beta-barrel domain-containing protein n=1 Tax=Aquicella siphonis TaxID=254247 RepID=A0A5E4PHM3_9COXI|nr:outer membrane beta-barrel protein [Aquicella siphonis]VVC75947.1 hypothetical protein AQUSIP_12480 [Aquicella siphonis]
MKKIFYSFVLSSIGLATLSSHSAYAGNRPGALTLTAGGGYVYLDSKREMNNKGFGMLELGYNLTEHWGVEGFLAGFKTRFKRSVNDTRHVSGTVFNFDGVYHFSPFKIVEPYILAGVGITGLNPNRNDANNEGNINAAIGAQIFVANSVALRLEARDAYTWVGGKNDVYVNGGVSVLFDLC